MGKVEVRNTSNQPQHGWFGSRHSGYDFNITNVQTGAVAPKQGNAFGLATYSGNFNGLLIPAGDSLYGQFLLTAMYQMSEAGTYSVQVIDGRPIIYGKALHLRSNTITVQILPK